MAKNKKLSKKKTQAEKANKHQLYEDSVQCSEFEIDWVVERFAEMRGRPLRVLREDFCGTANAACEYVKRHPENTAIGVDFDGDVLQWGRGHHLAKLQPAAQARIKLLQQDVKLAETPNMDALLAMNFSYWIFDSRPSLLEYFKQAYKNLKDDGILFMDAFGGYDCFNDDEEEETEHEGFSYVWNLHSFNPITNLVTYYIHFRFDDGSSIERAFEYHWRHWSLPEIKELLEEAGFQAVTFWMQGWDEDKDEATDEFFVSTEADADAGWVAYITAEK